MDEDVCSVVFFWVFVGFCYWIWLQFEFDGPFWWWAGEEGSPRRKIYNAKRLYVDECKGIKRNMWPGEDRTAALDAAYQRFLRRIEEE